PRQPTTQPCAAAVVFAPRPRRPPSSALFPYTTLFRSLATPVVAVLAVLLRNRPFTVEASAQEQETAETPQRPGAGEERSAAGARPSARDSAAERSGEHADKAHRTAEKGE